MEAQLSSLSTPDEVAALQAALAAVTLEVEAVQQMQLGSAIPPDDDTDASLSDAML
jgi:hypothetical protein